MQKSFGWRNKKKSCKAMTAVQTVKDSLPAAKTKVKVVNEIKEKAGPSIMNRRQKEKRAGRKRSKIKE